MTRRRGGREDGAGAAINFADELGPLFEDLEEPQVAGAGAARALFPALHELGRGVERRGEDGLGHAAGCRSSAAAEAFDAGVVHQHLHLLDRDRVQLAQPFALGGFPA